jgi:hypothetical protein
VPAQPVDATLACSLSAGVRNPKVCRGRVLSWRKAQPLTGRNGAPGKPLCAKLGNPSSVQVFRRSSEPLALRAGVPESGLHSFHDEAWRCRAVRTGSRTRCRGPGTSRAPLRGARPRNTATVESVMSSLGIPLREVQPDGCLRLGDFAEPCPPRPSGHRRRLVELEAVV